MGGLAALTVVFYAGLAAVQLPELWGRKERQGELWAVAVLLLLGLGFSLSVVLGFSTLKPWLVIKALFEPLGTALFKLED